ncbi:MAG: DUF4345 family protein [Candidatus Binatia bacterium]
MGERVFLGVTGALWLLYGLYCFASPGSLAEGAGVVYQTPTGSTELRAMYGGLQAAIGLLALAGVARADLARPALLAMAFLTTGLATARVFGVLLDGGLSGYTVMGLVFEIGSAVLATRILRRA